MKMLARLALLVLGLLCASGAAHAQQLRPLSAADKARLDSLLSAFDPQSYHFSYRYLEGGQVRTATVGRAVGLANLRQSNTVRRVPDEVAGTNNTINIFKEFAGTNNTINIFREFAGTNNTINIFREAGLNDRARELNLLLQRYYVPSRTERTQLRPAVQQPRQIQQPTQPRQ